MQQLHVISLSQSHTSKVKREENKVAWEDMQNVKQHVAGSAWIAAGAKKAGKGLMTTCCWKQFQLESWWRWNCKKQSSDQAFWVNKTDANNKNTWESKRQNKSHEQQLQNTTSTTNHKKHWYLLLLLLKPSRHSLSWVLYVIHLGVSSGLLKQHDSVTHAA